MAKKVAPTKAEKPKAVPNPPRRKPKPSKVGDDPCFNCGRPGSTCLDCGEVVCATCNQQPYLTAGHQPADHLIAPPVADVPTMIVAAFEETPTCEMCGWATIALTYCSGVCVPAPQGRFMNMRSRSGEAQPHFHRTCGRCKYEWLMARPVIP